MAKRLKPTSRWNERWYRELSFKAKVILDFMEDKSATDHNGTGIFVADFGLMEFQMGKGFSIDEEELLELLGSIVDKIGENTFFITTYFNDHYGDAKDTYAAKVAAKERLQKRGLMDGEGRIIRRSRGSLPPQSPDTPPTLPIDSGESLNTLGCVELNQEGGSGETIARASSSAEVQKTKPPAEAQGQSTLPVELSNPRELAELWNIRMASVESADGSPMPLVDLEAFGPAQGARWDAAAARLADRPSRAYWVGVIDRMARSKFCRGKGARDGWVASFDFLVKEDTATRVMENGYGCRAPRFSRSESPPLEEISPREFSSLHPDIPKVLVALSSNPNIRTPWESLKRELREQTVAAIESAGGWDKCIAGSPEEVQARFMAILNQPSAAGNTDRVTQAHALMTGLAGGSSNQEAQHA